MGYLLGTGMFFTYNSLLFFETVHIFVDEKRGSRREALDYEIELSLELEKELRLPVDVKLLNYAPLRFRYKVTKGEAVFSRDEDASAPSMNFLTVTNITAPIDSQLNMAIYVRELTEEEGNRLKRCLRKGKDPVGPSQSHYQNRYDLQMN